MIENTRNMNIRPKIVAWAATTRLPGLLPGTKACYVFECIYSDYSAGAVTDNAIFVATPSGAFCYTGEPGTYVVRWFVPWINMLHLKHNSLAGSTESGSIFIKIHHCSKLMDKGKTFSLNACKPWNHLIKVKSNVFGAILGTISAFLGGGPGSRLTKSRGLRDNLRDQIRANMTRHKQFMKWYKYVSEGVKHYNLLGDSIHTLQQPDIPNESETNKKDIAERRKERRATAQKKKGKGKVSGAAASSDEDTGDGSSDDEDAEDDGGGGGSAEVSGPAVKKLTAMEIARRAAEEEDSE